MRLGILIARFGRIVNHFLFAHFLPQAGYLCVMGRSFTRAQFSGRIIRQI
jgi:hypothetical protein